MANDKDFILKNAIEIGGSTKVTIGDAPASGSVTVGYADASTWSYDSVSFSLTGQGTSPSAIFVKPDGTKFYTIDDAANEVVYQYSMTTAWDLSTATYDNKSKNISAQEDTPQSIFFKPDGTKMYVLGQEPGEYVFQYTLSTAWDVSTASYDNEKKSLTAQGGTPSGMYFKSDGLSLYTVEKINDYAYQYSMTTAWDISTISYSGKSISISSEEINPETIFFKPDGLKFYVIGISSDSVHQYTLSTAWDISTASYDSVAFSVSSEDGAMYGMFFKPDGTKMYTSGANTDTVYQYTTGSTTTTETFDTSTGNYFTHTPSADSEYGFSNAGDVQTWQLEVTGASSGYASVSDWSYDSKSFSTVATSNEANPPSGVAFNNDGTKMFVCSNGSDVVVEYDLSTAYDVSTSVYNSVSFSLSSTATVSQGLEFNNDGTKMYVVGNSTDKIFEYDLSTAFNLSTASYNSVSFSVASQDTNPFDIRFKPDGTSLYIVGSTNDTVFQYTLTTAFDLSTASYANKSFSVSSQETGPEGIAFNSSGTKMYVVGSTGDDINQYSLSTAYDVSTASFDNLTFSVSAQTTSPRVITFNADGTKVYVVGSSANTVYQYSTSEAITITWDADIQWAGGTAPDSPAANEKDLYTITTDDGGTTYVGVQSGDNFS
jgi:DNA-binding beta-propeller fold protein YncE